MYDTKIIMYNEHHLFWIDFLKYCEEKKSIFVGKSAPQKSYMSKTINGIRIDLCAYKSTKLCKHPIRVEVYFTGKNKIDHNEAFEHFFKRKTEIEHELGFELTWAKENMNVKSRKVYYHNPELTFGENNRLIFEFFDAIATKIFQVFIKYAQ